jgi:hypothetical protein
LPYILATLIQQVKEGLKIHSKIICFTALLAKEDGNQE